MFERKERGILVALDTGIIALLVIVMLAMLNISGITLAEVYREFANMVMQAYLFVF